MKKILLFFSAFVIIILLSGCGKSIAGKEYTADIFAMDTVMSITAYGDNAEEAVKTSVEEINRLDNLLSTGKEDSEIFVLNKNKKEEVSIDTFNLIASSIRLYNSTEGAFDITIYPVMRLWGFTDQNYKVPDDNEIKEMLMNVDSAKIDIDIDSRNITIPENVEIDLGGIAKGYTSQIISEIFTEYNIESGIISLGGNVQTVGRKTDGSLWRVGVKNPKPGYGNLGKEDYIGVIACENKACVTSGGYERYFEEDGKIYHHIIDPATGKPANSGLLNVTVVCEDGTIADGLSTSLFVMGKDKALEYWKQNPLLFDCILVDDSGNVTITEGLEKSYSSKNEYSVYK